MTSTVSKWENNAPVISVGGASFFFFFFFFFFF